MAETVVDSEAFHPVTGYHFGLVGRITERHADYRVRHWGFTVLFETRVAI